MKTVVIRDCSCPGTPHPDGDEVYLHSTLPMLGGIVAEQAMVGAKSTDELTQTWLLIFVRYGAYGWNLVDEDGPVPFDVDVLLGDWMIGRPVALKAADLYQEAVAAPLAQRRSKPSPTGPTADTTSRTRKRTASPSA